MATPSLTNIDDIPTKRQVTSAASRVYDVLGWFNDTDVVDIQLHGFEDASCVGYGGVVYIRYFHADTSVVISLVASKTGSSTEVAIYSQVRVPPVVQTAHFCCQGSEHRQG